MVLNTLPTTIDHVDVSIKFHIFLLPSCFRKAAEGHMTDEVEDSEIMFIMYAVSVMLTLMPLLLSLHVENINKYIYMSPVLLSKSSLSLTLFTSSLTSLILLL